MSSEEEKTVYRIIGNNIRFAGQTHKIGKKISLTAEDAERLKGFLEPLEEELAEDTAEIDAFKEMISKLNGQLKDLFFQNDENVGLVQERDKTIVELNTKLDASDEANKILTASLADRDKTIEGLNAQVTKLKEALTKKEGGKK